MSSSESFHNKAGRRALEQGLAQANEAHRVHIRTIGQLISHGAHAAIAGNEVLAHLARVEAERAAAVPLPPTREPKAKSAKVGRASRTKAAKRKSAASRKARARGR